MARATRPHRLATATDRRVVQGDATKGAVHFDRAPRPGSPGSRRALLVARSRQYSGDEGHGARLAPSREDDPVLDPHHGAGREAVRAVVHHRARTEAGGRRARGHQADTWWAPSRPRVRWEPGRGGASVRRPDPGEQRRQLWAI